MTALGIKKIKGYYWIKVDSTTSGPEADTKAYKLRSEGQIIRVIRTDFSWDIYSRILECG